jgi:hypothetical protein
LVSALVWGTRGPEFKSRQPDQPTVARSRRRSFAAVEIVEIVEIDDDDDVAGEQMGTSPDVDDVVAERD